MKEQNASRDELTKNYEHCSSYLLKVEEKCQEAQSSTL
jgi:hypothetical protein